MKKVLSLLLVFIMMTTVVFATEENKIISEDESDLLEDSEEKMLIDEYEDSDINVISGDVYKCNNEVTITDAVDGNVYVMAQKVKIENAYIYGNLFVMAQEIEIIDSEIDTSTYLLGEKIIFSGTTYDLYALGSEVNLTEESNVWRSAKIAANVVNINGTIDVNADITCENINVSNTAQINGNLNYWSENEGMISSDAQIVNINFHKEEEIQKDNNVIKDYVPSLANFIFKTLIVALIVVFLVNKFNILQRTEKVANEFLTWFGKGALLLVSIPIVFVLCMVSVLGIGFGFSLIAIYASLLYISISLVSIEIAYRILLKSQNQNNKVKLIGIAVGISAIIWAIGIVPVVGGIVKFVLSLIGLGIVFDLLFKREKIDEN